MTGRNTGAVWRHFPEAPATAQVHHVAGKLERNDVPMAYEWSDFPHKLLELRREALEGDPVTLARRQLTAAFSQRFAQC